MTGFGQVEDPQGGGDVGREQLAPADRALDAALDLLGQVVARREGPAGALEHDDPDVRVGGGRVERGDHRLDERPGQGVELGRPVEASGGRPTASAS